MQHLTTYSGPGRPGKSLPCISHQLRRLNPQETNLVAYACWLRDAVSTGLW